MGSSKVRGKMVDIKDVLPLVGCRRGIYQVRASGEQGQIDWRLVPCYGCKSCRELRFTHCRYSRFKTFDLVTPVGA